MKNLVRRLGEPVAITAIRQAMMLVGQHFVAGQTVEEAIATNQSAREKGYFHSYDMLGEAALTQPDAERYQRAYRHCIETIAAHEFEPEQAGMSIKLSALHPRFELRQYSALEQLRDRLHELLLLAHQHNISVTLDAEESWRLEPTLLLFADMIGQKPFRNWGRFGIAVQTYSKRAPGVISWLMSLSRSIHCQIPVRLVKGAYWDTEIKQAQLLGLPDYPVFTQKSHTDQCYLACAHRLFNERHFLYPQFATHNAHTAAALLVMAEANPDTRFEFQRLHGMGEALHDHILTEFEAMHCRVYTPVGHYRELLPYLVRRLLENGANTSFIRLLHQNAESSSLLEEPSFTIRSSGLTRNPTIPLPTRLYGAERPNPVGINLESLDSLHQTQTRLDPYLSHTWTPTPWAKEQKPIHSPADPADFVGEIALATATDCQAALERSLNAFPDWCQQNVEQRADLLCHFAKLLETHRDELMALAMREAGKTLPNALGELREAMDFCYYYAQQARQLQAEPKLLKGPTGEENRLTLEGRGCVLCISPWNFPLAIFTGQIVAALVTGNTVLAKPSIHTPLIAARTIELLHAAGFPADVVQLVPAEATVIEHSLLNDPRLAGVMLTGSTAAAARINRLLASREGPIIPFIAETGGQNAMIVDSSALPEQVVKDVVMSAFDSAGQRCSALRVLFIQNDIRDTLLDMLKGHMAQLHLGLPHDIETDIGPVINAEAQRMLLAHIQQFEEKNQVIYQTALPAFCQQGYYVSPTLIAIDGMSELSDEVFGPILHVVGYEADRVDEVIDQINSTGFGLTLGIHSRITSFCEDIASRVRAGNVYINRNMIGATVGVQPFGGVGRSGTGPKAGGPLYLTRLVHEKTRSTNTAAIGGNTHLLAEF
jgi:RHH-type proline utilization regulon transcriptional repressor/proline dehydrogenase/delta 1-pyrroline-5-carboxylate dehydrogenase